MCYIGYNGCTATELWLARSQVVAPCRAQSVCYFGSLKIQNIGTQVRTACVSGRVLCTVAGRPPKGGTQNPDQPQSERRVCPRFFSGTLVHGTKTETDGTERGIFCIWWDSGTARVNLMDTTINCPTKVSHFRDGWDTFFLGQGTKLGRVRSRGASPLLQLPNQIAIISYRCPDHIVRILTTVRERDLCDARLIR